MANESQMEGSKWDGWIGKTGAGGRQRAPPRRGGEPRPLRPGAAAVRGSLRGGRWCLTQTPDINSRPVFPFAILTACISKRDTNHNPPLLYLASRRKHILVLCERNTTISLLATTVTSHLVPTYYCYPWISMEQQMNHLVDKAWNKFLETPDDQRLCKGFQFIAFPSRQYLLHKMDDGGLNQTAAALPVIYLFYLILHHASHSNASPNSKCEKKKTKADMNTT